MSIVLTSHYTTRCQVSVNPYEPSQHRKTGPGVMTTPLQSWQGSKASSPFGAGLPTAAAKASVGEPSVMKDYPHPALSPERGLSQPAHILPASCLYPVCIVSARTGDRRQAAGGRWAVGEGSHHAGSYVSQRLAKSWMKLEPRPISRPVMTQPTHGQGGVKLRSRSRSAR